MITYEPIDSACRAEVTAFLSEQWGGTEMIVRGERVDMTNPQGIRAMEDGRMIGLITYRIQGSTAEMLSLNSLRKGQGIASALIERLVILVRNAGCARIVLVTTNDNLDALALYQKRGFDIIRLYRNTMDYVRQIKPAVPRIGENGIPLRHEIELERVL